MLRALDAMSNEKVKNHSRQAGKLVLEPVTVSMKAYAYCGKIGKVPLQGQALRKATVSVKARAPQETAVEICCSYSTTHAWKNRYGEVVRIETVPCNSSGKFEQELYGRLIRYMSP